MIPSDEDLTLLQTALIKYVDNTPENFVEFESILYNNQIHYHLTFLEEDQKTKKHVLLHVAS